MKASKKKKASDKGRTFTIVLSIVIALFLWSYVIIQVNPTKVETIARIPVQLLNIQSLTARQLAISGDGEYMVDVVVEGRRADIIKLSSDDIVAEVDLFGWSKGENYIPVNVKIPPALKLIEVRSAKIQVTIEDLVALSKPVVVSYRGSFPKDTEAGEVDLRPAEIEVTGAKSAVESVHEIRVYVEAEDIIPEGSEIQCEAVPLGDAEIIVENVRLSSNYVGVYAKLLQLKEVPLIIEKIGTPGEGRGIDIQGPETVVIKGDRAEIKDIDSIRTEPLDIGKITQNGIISLNLLLPDNVELSKKNPKIIATVSIEQIADKEFRFTSDEIIFEGLTQGRSIKIDKVEMQVTVTGVKNVVDKLQRNQLQLYVDAEGLEPGNITVPLLVTSDVQMRNIVVNPAQISITIIDTEQEITIE